MQSSFVFYDPTGKRWMRFRRAFGITGVVLAAALVLILIVLFSNPQLPALGLPQVQNLRSFSDVPSIVRGEKVSRNVPFRSQKTIKYIRNGGNPVMHPKNAPNPRENGPIVFGFYVNWDDPASKNSLRLNLTHLTHLIPEWLRLKDAGGDLIDETDPVVLQIANDAKLPVLVEINNFREGWQAGDLHHVLTNAKARENLLDNILANVEEHKFAGVNIDFEELKSKDREAMVGFMRELGTRMKPLKLIVTQSVPTGDDNYDLKRLGEINDYLVPMAYDEHFQSGAPGPVASEDWFQAQLEAVAKLVPPRKTVVGIGNYGYDWIIGQSGGSEVAFRDVIGAALANNTSVQWDAGTNNPVLRYQNTSGQHEIWFLDAATALNHVQDVSDGGFRGVAVWRLGAEDPGLWNVVDPRAWPVEPFNPFPLFHLTSEKTVNHNGTGEVLRITATPRDGARNVWLQDDGNYAEKYATYPSYYVVQHSGSSVQKQLGITFDDGPSAEFTPRILDILRARRVPATFFVVGVNAEALPGLVQREYNEGHTIGNHTYTHPNIAKESEERVKIELSTTLRLIENGLGRGTTLFRPPYNADSEPQTPEEIKPIVEAQSQGYITIGESIDPRDWEKGITPDAIVKEVLSEVDESAGVADRGHLILMHDAGGDRNATVAALPRIIDTLRARGYEFVSLPQLMNDTRDHVMPVPTPDEARLARIEGDALTTKGNFKKIIGLLFLTAIYLSALRSLIYGALAFVQKYKTRRRRFDPAFHTPVSVIIAAYNEETVIVKTVQSVLDNGYTDLEIIVVDDGSTDGTLNVLRAAFGADERVRLFTQPNGGKSSALNHGIRESVYPVLVALDADTVFRKGTIEKLVRHFCDPRVGAVSGNARVGNRRKWITRFQSIEYIMGFNLDRRALDLLNAITVVPGAAGAWRKDLVLQAGGFREDTLAEDTDITLSIRRMGYRITYEEEAVAYTEAPENTRALAKQRFRWSFGTLQAVWKHRDATFNPNYGFLGMVALPSIWIFQVLLAFLSPFAEVAMFVALFAGNWRIVLLYYFGLYLMELVTALLAYALEGVAPWDVSLLFFQRIYYRQLMYYVLGKSILYAMRGRLVGWGKLERHASVQGA